MIKDVVLSAPSSLPEASGIIRRVERHTHTHTGVVTMQLVLTVGRDPVLVAVSFVSAGVAGGGGPPCSP